MNEESLLNQLDKAIESGIALANQYIRQTLAMKGEDAPTLSRVLTQMALREMLHVQLIAETMKCVGHLPHCMTESTCPAGVGESIREMLRIDRMAALRMIELSRETAALSDPDTGCLLRGVLDQIIKDEEENCSILKELSEEYVERRRDGGENGDVGSGIRGHSDA
jgi:bacterioferritin (cytochrome b1)